MTKAAEDAIRKYTGITNPDQLNDIEVAIRDRITNGILDWISPADFDYLARTVAKELGYAR